MPRHERRGEDQEKLGFASLGFFLLLTGVIWIITPNLFQKVIDFFRDFELAEISPNVFLPAPVHHHPVVYSAFARFCFVFGLFQIVVLVLRFFFRDSVDRVAGTFSGIIFWLGVGFFSNLLAAESLDWFGSFGWFIVFVGLSLVVRSFLVLMPEVVLPKL